MKNSKELVIIASLSVVVGTITGLIYVGLFEAMSIAREVHDVVRNVNPFLTLALASLGGLITGFLLKYVSIEIAGPGIDAAINAIVKRWGFQELKTTISKFIATVATVGLGASGGLVGPMAQIGTGIGSVLSRLFRLNRDSSKKIALVGLGAGIASVLQAPVSGALACMEILYRGPGIEAGVLVPSLFATFASATVTYIIMGGWYSTLAIRSPHELLLSPRVLLCSAIIGFASGILSRTFSKLYFTIEELFSNAKSLPLEVKPLIGCLIAASIAIAYPQVYGTGWNLVWLSMSSTSISLLLTLLVFKTLATVFTLGSGGSGGVFAPTIALGALLGSMLSNAMSLNKHKELLTIVGIASMLSGLCRVPLAAVVLVAEVAGGLYALPPAIIASLLAYVTAGPKATIYKSQLEASQ